MKNENMTFGWWVLSKVGLRRTIVKTVAFHFRLAIAFAFAAVTIALMPEGAERAALITALKPYEWEATGEWERKA